MGEIYKITDGTSSIDISPIRGQNEPESRGREVLRGKDGKEDVYEWGGTEVYEMPFNNVSKTEADLLIDWWVNMTTLTFTPDLQGAPGTTREVKIAEMTRPMQMWGGDWDTLFAGMLTLYQISSVSFSSSSQSVSPSKSCSSLSQSQSCSTGSSSSCLFIVTSVSDSRSSSRSCSSSVSRSCSSSLSRSCSESVSRSCFDSVSSGVSLSVCGNVSVSSCEDLSVCGNVSVSSCDFIADAVGVSFTSRSCSEDVSVVSCSSSVGGQSCSESGAG
jgi:hypothetical protein